MRRTLPVLGIAVLLAALAAPGASAAPPRATTVPCGAVLTTSVRLAADVVCPAGGGITLAADGIELNLNGHALVGPGIEITQVGVEVSALDVVVRNGSIRNWAVGVRAETVDYDSDIDLPTVVSALLREVRVDRNSTGVAAGPEGSLLVRNSHLTGNQFAGRAQHGGRLRVETSTVAGNRSGLGSFMVRPAGLVVRNSTIRDNAGAGVYCRQDGRYDVVGSTLQRNGTGLRVFQCNGQVADTKFVWNKAHVGGELMLEQDTMYLCRNSYTRDGLPIPITLPYETTGCTT